MPCANRAVYLHAQAVLNVAGDEPAALRGETPAPRPLSFDPARLAHALATPRLPTDRFDRKIQRSVEPQGLRLLYCAARLARALYALDLPPERVALCAAIPEVDAPSPCWDAVEAMGRQPERPVAGLLANTPPLHALTLLNSSVMAYVAEALHCNGPMGGYCSQANAGLDALIEAVLQVAEDNADAALVISSSPNLTPALYLRDGAGPRETVHGEGAAALLLATAPAASGPRVRIAGHACGYIASAERAEVVLRQVLDQALQGERLTLSDVRRIVADRHDPLLAELLRDAPVQAGSRCAVGELGASGLLIDLACVLAEPSTEVWGESHYALLLSHTAAGHVGAVLLAIDEQEKGA